LNRLIACLALCGLVSPAPAASLKNSARKAEKNGWIYVHLEGTPAEIGFQNGFHLAQEIKELQKITALELTHDTGKDYAFFRAAAEKRLWPRIEQEYREELQGIVEGLAAKYVNLDIWDIVVMNASLELNGYYTD